MADIPYQIFGSSSSVDSDICFFVDEIKSVSENKLILNRLQKEISFQTDKPINGNLGIISNGILTTCFKGIPDELNNSLFHTYDLHKQGHKKLILRTVDRQIDIKLIRCARTIVSYFTRTVKRTEAKNALRGDFSEKLSFLENIDLSEYADFGKNGSVIEIYKSIAFQLGQSLALMENKEVFTKESIALEFPTLTSYLFRTSESSKNLQLLLNRFIQESQDYLPKMNQFTE